MGELNSADNNLRSSTEVFFDEVSVLVVTAKSFGGFAGVSAVTHVDHAVPDAELGGLVVEAWNAKERSPDYDEEALDESWGMVAEAFNVDHYGELRYVAVNRGADSIGVVPTEWKGDNRFFRPQDGERLPLDVSDEELGAAVRRAMELTVS